MSFEKTILCLVGVLMLDLRRQTADERDQLVSCISNHHWTLRQENGSDCCILQFTEHLTIVWITSADVSENEESVVRKQNEQFAEIAQTCEQKNWHQEDFSKSNHLEDVDLVHFDKSQYATVGFTLTIGFAHIS